MKTLKICLVILCLLHIRAVGLPRLSGANFFMKEMSIISRVYGRFLILLDDDDYDRVLKYKWHVCPNGLKYKKLYIARRPVVSKNPIKRRTITLHSFIYGVSPGHVIDHIDGNQFNNQKNNLRFCTIAENSRNKPAQKDSKTGLKGVFFQKALNKYRAQIKTDGKRISLGCFNNLIDATLAYNTAALKYHGEFARLNNIPCADYQV